MGRNDSGLPLDRPPNTNTIVRGPWPTTNYDSPSIMRADNDEADASCCASCGIAEVDDIKLKECIHCDLVKYCSDQCQMEHKSQHEEACKTRAAELRDELLFEIPGSSHLGDCPICMIPLSLDLKKYRMMGCCSKMICKGCHHANQLRAAEASLDDSCPFCREPVPSTHEEVNNLMIKRIEVNDPEALCHQGSVQFTEGDYNGAFEYWSKAAELGDVMAHYKLSLLYRGKRGVAKDREKEIYHLEEAAVGGHPDARHNLGCNEGYSGNLERAMKHWIIAARQGDDRSIKKLIEFFKRGYIRKEVLEDTLRAHHAAVDETKSPQREAAEEFYRNVFEEAERMMSLAGF